MLAAERQEQNLARALVLSVEVKLIGIKRHNKTAPSFQFPAITRLKKILFITGQILTWIPKKLCVYEKLGKLRNLVRQLH